MDQVEKHASFNGSQEVWKHDSKVLKCPMKLGVYLPQKALSEPCPVLYWLSGLTCTEQNFITKAGIQQYASEHGLIVVAPDTSPRGENIPNDQTYDLGQGASFYLNATETPWSENFRMFDYITNELPALIEKTFKTTTTRGISGHSMGGHGALVCALKKPGFYQSVSAFSPIVAPSKVPWGQKAFAAYLGNDQKIWEEWDTCALLAISEKKVDLLIDQGLSDEFLTNQLKPELLKAACEKSGHKLNLRMREGHDHSYYFISSFIGEHVEFHAKALNGHSHGCDR